MNSNNNNNIGNSSVVLKDVNLGYWHIVQFITPEIALAAKKFIRSRKTDRDIQRNGMGGAGSSSSVGGNMGSSSNNSYKFANRRVRIVLLSQDFFTVLYDQIN